MKRFMSMVTSLPPNGENEAAWSGRERRSSWLPTSRSPHDARGSRLQKPSSPRRQSRSGSVSYMPNSSGTDQPSLRALAQLHADDDVNTLPLPPTFGGGFQSRASSMDRSASSRPGTPTGSRPSTPSVYSPISPFSAKKDKKPGSWGARQADQEEERGPWAWIAGHPQRKPFDTHGLVNAQPVPEVWDSGPDGNCYVYLFPPGSGRGPSFKVDSVVFQSSPVLCKLAFGDADANGNRQAPVVPRLQNFQLPDPLSSTATLPRQGGKTDTSSSASSHASLDSHEHVSQLSTSGSTESHLYLPFKLHVPIENLPTQGPTRLSRGEQEDAGVEDLQALIDLRNFFAFLCGSSLVATAKKSSFFHIFMTVAGILNAYEFKNLDDSTFGDVASSSFDNYVAELGLRDVRHSREKTLEGIVLGERMKSVFLYNEAFTHAAGKHDDLMSLKSVKYDLISTISKNRLVRAHRDLEKRVASIRRTLTTFEFPFLFSGIMNSKTSTERKEGVRFESWKEGFLGFRKSLVNYLKQRYGDWPPKASSKKNTLETSGLNRLVVYELYEDLSAVYDLLVDRTQLTSRTVDGVDMDAKEDATTRAIRAVLSEYDRSSPPVKPPVPFDLPQLPTLENGRADLGTGDKKKDLKALQKKLKDNELSIVLSNAINHDVPKRPFLGVFLEMEKRAAKGSTIHEAINLRIGQWIFMYVVLQALPMLACDAPDLMWTHGVEYFLCEPPRSGVPWADPNVAGAGKLAWFSVGESGGVVQLPSDVVEHGVEGIYRRSHCWLAAEKWSLASPTLNSALHERAASSATANTTANTTTTGGYADDLGVPGGLPQFDFGSRPASRMSRRNSSVLEAITMPATPSPDFSSLHPCHRSGGSTDTVGMRGRGSLQVSPDGRRSASMTPHVVDSSKTFDSILGSTGTPKKRGRKK